jgi:hypothetical protein
VLVFIRVGWFIQNSTAKEVNMKMGHISKALPRIVLGVIFMTIFMIVGKTTSSISSPDLSTIWWWAWRIIVTIVAVGLVVLFWWRSKKEVVSPPPSTKKTLIQASGGNVFKTIVTVIIVWTTINIVGILAIVTTGHLSGFSTKSDSFSIITLTAREDWSEWIVIPPNAVKTKFVASQSGLVIRLRNSAGEEVDVVDTPEKQQEVPGIAVMFKHRSKPQQQNFTVMYTY